MFRALRLSVELAFRLGNIRLTAHSPSGHARVLFRTLCREHRCLRILVLAGWNRRAQIKTFDDGSLNVCAGSFSATIGDEGPAHFRAFKAALFGRTNHDIVTAAAAHYTIFDPELSVYPARKFVRLDLFPPPVAATATNGRS